MISFQARALYSEGDIEEAHAASRTAMLFLMINVAVGVGLLCAIFIVPLVAAYFNLNGRY